MEALFAGIPEKCKEVLSKVPKPFIDPEISKYLKGPIRIKVPEVQENTIPDEDGETNVDESNFDIAEAILTKDFVLDRDMARLISNVCEKAGVTFNIGFSSVLHEIPNYDSLRADIEKDVYEEVIGYVMATELRDNGCFMDVIQALKENDLYSYFLDLEMPVIKHLLDNSKYSSKELHYML